MTNVMPPVDARKVLVAAVSLCFALILVGQWLFVGYIAGLYGYLTFAGGLPAWAGTHLQNGYIIDDSIGNNALAAHVLLSIIIHGAGPLQLVPSVRQQFPKFHRWNGRIFVSLCLLISAAGLFLTWARPTGFGGLVGQVSITIVALLICITAYESVKNARLRCFGAHRQWAMRLFLVASAVWFARLINYGGGFIIKSLGIEMDGLRTVVMYTSFFGQFLIPLAVLECYFVAQRHKGRRLTLSVAALLGTCALLMAVGIYAAVSIAWWPRISGV